MHKETRPKIGVIGVGHLGQHHVKHFEQIETALLQGVFDVDQERSKTIAGRYNTISYETMEGLINDCDALSIVTSTPEHASVAEKCIRAGKHVFIEKPITKTTDEANNLLNLAEEHNVIIQVGHIERLNPALLALKDIKLDPKFIEVQRLAPYTTRGTEVPVVLDLMIHDIDIILALVDSSVKNIRASGVSIITDSVDIANARIRFNNGTVASITSSRIAKDKVRKIKIFQKNLYITIDFLLGLTEVYHVEDAEEQVPGAIVSAPLSQSGRSRKIVYEKPPVTNIDALQMELRNFVDSINGNATPIVDGAAGLEALDVATKIHNMIIEDTV